MHAVPFHGKVHEFLTLLNGTQALCTTFMKHMLIGCSTTSIQIWGAIQHGVALHEACATNGAQGCGSHNMSKYLLGLF